MPEFNQKASAPLISHMVIGAITK
jgi:hypothetical protein